MASFAPVVADDAMKGPTRTSNYVLPGVFVMGDDPMGGGDRLTQVLKSGVTTFVDLRDAVNATNYLEKGGIHDARYVSFPFRCEDFGARNSQVQFIYSLVDALRAGDRIYVHDYTGHGTCGVVGACVLAVIYGWSGMKACNMIAQLHELRENTYGSDCPVDERSKDLKYYVKEVVRGFNYQPGAAAPLGGAPPAPVSPPPVTSKVTDSPSRFANTAQNFGGGTQQINVFGDAPSQSPQSSARFAHSRNKHGGGHSSINIFGGGGGDVGSVPPSSARSTGSAYSQQREQYQPPQQQQQHHQQQMQQHQGGFNAGVGGGVGQPTYTPDSDTLSQSLNASQGRSVRGARSCGGGVSQVNLFGGDNSYNTSSAQSDINTRVGRQDQQRAPQMQQQQQQQQVHNNPPVQQILPPHQMQQQQQQQQYAPMQQTVPQSAPPQGYQGGAPGFAFPPGTVSVHLTRPSMHTPWGFALDEFELVSIGEGTPAAQSGLMLGGLVGLNNKPITGDEDLEPLGVLTEVTFHLIPAKAASTTPVRDAITGIVSCSVSRQPGESWGVDVDDLWVVGVAPGSPCDRGGVVCGKLLFINNTHLSSMEDCAMLAGMNECVLGILPNTAIDASKLPPSVSPQRDLMQQMNVDEESVHNMIPQQQQHQQQQQQQQVAPPQEVTLPDPFNTRDKADLAKASGPTRTSNWVVRDRVLCGAAMDLRKVSDIEAIANTGITTVVNLKGSGERPAAYFPTLEKVAKRKVKFINYAFASGTIPGAGELKGFKELIMQIVGLVRSGEIVYIHCTGGHGETGMVVACVLCVLYNLPHMRALNSTDSLHSTRADTEDQCSPQTQEQRIFVLETLKSLSEA